MIKPDILVVVPKSVDYPLFRYNLKRFREYFNEVYIAISDNGVLDDYTQFWTTALPFAHFKSTPKGGGAIDWRNIAVNALLDKSKADHVLFFEPDFLIRDERFFEVILNVSDYDFLYYEEGGRIHPACALVPRHIIDKTSKDFSARPPAYDHFGLFFQEAVRLTNGADLEMVGLLSGEDFAHIGGLTQNYYAQPYYKPSEFLTYNHYSLKLPIVYGEFSRKMERIDRDSMFEESGRVEAIASMFPKEVVK